ncbi:uncharacterized protein LOC117398398 isoform X1 [Acipenser ruthenus]|uniref:uncharacterized protein LOC117398398 isoform X1 n=1 Tax=Acipenser ruthenus TaxID=7906 RepID=UPI0027426E53|nr:uncharacterized protein LOC117398398 isoform X1 [Acipenser ruthenus]
MISWCFLALSDSGKLLEMGTGEGKSCVIAMFAAMRVLMGEKVDIVSSSSVLSERDAEEWSKFYDHFGIKVDTNTAKTTDEDRKKCYQSDIVYGTVETFAADYLRQTFELKDICPDREFQCIIIDEVDSLLLDRGVQLTYLSTDTVSMYHLNTVLTMIWSTVSQYGLVATENRTFIRGPPLPFYKAVYDSIDTEGSGIEEPIDILRIAEEHNVVHLGFIQEIYRDREKLLEELKTVNQDAMLEFFKKAEEYLPYRFIAYTQDQTGTLQPELRSENDVQDIQDLSFLVLQDGLCCALYDSEELLWDPILNNVRVNLQFTPSENSKDKLNIPGFLRNLVEKKLETWVQNAFLAIKLKQGQEYVVEGDCILPVDFKSTGIVELNKKWGDGLQQFLEIKHQSKISCMSSVTNYISNVTYFKKYQEHIYGTTGTLGTRCDIQFLQELYPNLSTCSVPPFNRKKLFEVKGVITHTIEGWKTKICIAVEDQINPTAYRGGRAALVICESINKAYEVHAALKTHVSGQLKLYTRSDNNNLNILEDALNPGDVIVATNLAGRGTNIKVSDEVNESGGLFVVLTFLSQNARVELQAFGRTARKGKPGSAQIIMCSSHLQESLKSDSTLELVKESRDILAKNKVEHVMMDDIPEVCLREELFSNYCKTLLKIYNDIEDVEVRKATVAIMNEYWGIWLQIKSEEIVNLKQTELLKSLSTDMINAKHQSETNESPCASIYHYIKFANNALFDNNLSESARLYKKAMDLDPTWAAIAFYSHAYCTIKESNTDYLLRAIEELQKAKESMKYFTEECVVTLQLVKMCSRDSGESNTAFEKQIMTKCNVIGYFDKNINEALSKLTDIKKRGRDAEAVETSVFSLVTDTETEIQEQLYFFYKLGLENVFSVQEKPRFCWEGLLVFFLGVLQIVGGTLLTVFTAGTLATVGMSLITEGISDCISGIEAMVTGEFSWKSWAIEKSISVAVSLIGFGVGKLLAKGFKASKAAIKSFGKNLKSLPKVISKESRQGLHGVMKVNMKNAMKHTGKEIGQQIVMYGISKAEDKLIELIIEKIKNEVRDKAMTTVKADMERDPLGPLVDLVILSQLEDVEDVRDLLMDSNLKTQLKEIFQSISMKVLQPYCIDLDWQNTLSASILGVFNEAKQEVKGLKSTVLTAIQATHMAALGIDAVIAVTSLCKEFNNKYSENLKTFAEKNGMVEKVKKGQLSVNDKQILEGFKHELSDIIAKKLSDVVVQIFHDKFSSHLFNIAKVQANQHLSNYLRIGFKTERTKEKLKAGQNNSYIANNPVDIKSNKNLHTDKLQRVQSYAQKIKEIDTPGTILDLRILAEATRTKVVIFTEDNQGKLNKMQVVDPNTNTASQTVELVYKPKSDQYPDGHYDLCLSGKVVRLENEDKSCMFHALARGLQLTSSDEHVSSSVEKLRMLEAETLLNKSSQWASFIKRKQWTDGIRGGDWFMAEGAAPIRRQETKNELKKHLGIVKKYKKNRIFMYKSGIGHFINADHQPPVNSILSAYNMNQNSKLAIAMLEVATQSSPLNVSLIPSVHKYHGMNLPTSLLPQVLHRRFPSTISKKFREELAKSISTNNVRDAFKLTFIGAIPDYILKPSTKKNNNKTSNRAQLRLNAQRLAVFHNTILQSHINILNKWYKKLSPKNVMNQNDYNAIHTWINAKGYLDQNDLFHKMVVGFLP